MAVSSIFNPIKIGPPGFEQAYLGGGYLYNNNTHELLNGAKSMFGEEQRVPCLLNLGCGKPQIPSLDSVLEGDQDFYHL